MYVMFELSPQVQVSVHILIGSGMKTHTVKNTQMDLI